MQVYIVGAGAGDPELITVKGQKLLQKADVIIYAGSLVNPALLDFAKEGAEIHDSASMTLPEVIETIEKAVAKDSHGRAPSYRRSEHLRCDSRADGCAQEEGD